MRRYRILVLNPDAVYDRDPWFSRLTAMFYPHEDLTINDDERNARDFLVWLNERDVAYTLEFDSWTEDYDYSSDNMMSLYRLRERNREYRYDVLIDDDATATLIAMFFENYKEIIDPAVLAAREAEEKVRAEREKAEQAAREAEDARNRRRENSPFYRAPSAAVPDDVVEPFTRKLLIGIGRSLSNAIYGERHRP